MAAVEWISLVLMLIWFSFLVGAVHAWIETRRNRRDLDRLSKKWPTGKRPEDWRNGGIEEDQHS